MFRTFPAREHARSSFLSEAEYFARLEEIPWTNIVSILQEKPVLPSVSPELTEALQDKAKLLEFIEIFESRLLSSEQVSPQDIADLSALFDSVKTNSEQLMTALSSETEPAEIKEKFISVLGLLALQKTTEFEQALLIQATPSMEELLPEAPLSSGSFTQAGPNIGPEDILKRDVDRSIRDVMNRTQLLPEDIGSFSERVSFPDGSYETVHAVKLAPNTSLRSFRKNPSEDTPSPETMLRFLAESEKNLESLSPEQKENLFNALPEEYRSLYRNQPDLFVAELLSRLRSNRFVLFENSDHIAGAYLHSGGRTNSVYMGGNLFRAVQELHKTDPMAAVTAFTSAMVHEIGHQLLVEKMPADAQGPYLRLVSQRDQEVVPLTENEKAWVNHWDLYMEEGCQSIESSLDANGALRFIIMNSSMNSIRNRMQKLEQEISPEDPRFFSEIEQLSLELKNLSNMSSQFKVHGDYARTQTYYLIENIAQRLLPVMERAEARLGQLNSNLNNLFPDTPEFPRELRRYLQGRSQLINSLSLMHNLLPDKNFLPELKQLADFINNEQIDWIYTDIQDVLSQIDKIKQSLPPPGTTGFLKSMGTIVSMRKHLLEMTPYLPQPPPALAQRLQALAQQPQDQFFEQAQHSVNVMRQLILQLHMYDSRTPEYLILLEHLTESLNEFGPLLQKHPELRTMLGNELEMLNSELHIYYQALSTDFTHINQEMSQMHPDKQRQEKDAMMRQWSTLEVGLMQIDRQLLNLMEPYMSESKLGSFKTGEEVKFFDYRGNDRPIVKVGNDSW
ncbi:MAG: hypothetical protein P9M03_12180, partial [Candidatus Theseobacter exili]|nr:hypothetical protein [Candidatus Theseobacter exili]